LTFTIGAKAPSKTSAAALLFEEPIKGVARVSNVGERSRSLSLNDLAGFEKRTLIPQVLSGNPFRDRLGTFVIAGRIEMETILAAMQIRMAPRTLAVLGDSDLRSHGGSAESTAKDLSHIEQRRREHVARPSR
jgi:hypothetical protein